MQVKIREGVTEINDRIFYDTKKIIEIDTESYFDIEKITEIYLTKSLKKIDIFNFMRSTPCLQNINVDKENPYFDVIEGVLVTKDRKKLVAFPRGRKGSYTVPEGIEIIGKSSFRMGIFLEEVILPKSVKTIETKAFCDCVNLKNIELGGTETIGIEAFMKCFNLNVSGGGNLSVIKNKAFLKCREFPGFKLCDKVTKIGEEAFYGCDVANIDLGRGIIEIGDKAFVGKNISLSLFKEQEKLLREEIFAMNDKRKFSVSVNFKDKGRTAVLCGKIGCSNIIISDNEFDFSACDTPLKKKKPVKKAPGDEIKPVLIDEIEGRVHKEYFNPIRFNAFGVYDSGNYHSISNSFSSVAVVSENGFKKKKLTDLCKDIKIAFTNDIIHSHCYFDSTYWNICPYVYLYDNGDLLVNLSYKSCTGKWSDPDEYSMRKFIYDKIEDVIQLLRISPDLSSARIITDNKSEEGKYIKKQEEVLKAERDKTESFIGDQGSISKDPLEMQKHFKMRYKDFVVPDSEESLSEFFEDSFGNIFNFGDAAVYSEHEKANIGTRNRSYLNVYSKDGAKKATVKFKGYPVYIFQLDSTYYVVTQQDKTSKSPAKIRLFSFEL